MKASSEALCNPAVCSAPPSKGYMKAGDIIEDAVALMKELADTELAAISGAISMELDSVMKHHKRQKAGVHILQALASQSTDMGGSLPTLADLIQVVTTNSYDTRIQNKSSVKYDTDDRSKHADRKKGKLQHCLRQICRMRSIYCIPRETLLLTLLYKFKATPRKHWTLHCRMQHVMSEDWVTRGLKHPGVQAWKHPAWEGASKVFSLSVRDNKEFWRRVRFNRTTTDGEKVKNELIHTITGENIFIDDAVDSMAPYTRPSERWPYMDQCDYANAIASDEEIECKLKPKWLKHLELVTEETRMALFVRPPPEADKRQQQGPSVTHHFPIILNCGTSSYLDGVKIRDHIRQHAPAGTKYHVAGGDGAHVWVMMWLKAKFPKEFCNHVWYPCEFHGHNHVVDGVVRLCWSTIYEPIMLHFGEKNFVLKMNMKDYSTRLRWNLVILSGGILWLKTWCPPDLLRDIPKLLRKVRGNTPVWDMIGFIFYMASPIAAFKEANQCSDTEMMDFMWPYSLRIYGATTKCIYRCLCVLAHKVIKDSEPRVRHILRHWRTVADTNRRCAAMPLDLKNEKVTHVLICCCKITPNPCTDKCLLRRRSALPIGQGPD